MLNIGEMACNYIRRYNCSVASYIHILQTDSFYCYFVSYNNLQTCIIIRMELYLFAEINVIFVENYAGIIDTSLASLVYFNEVM